MVKKQHLAKILLITSLITAGATAVAPAYAALAPATLRLRDYYEERGFGVHQFTISSDQSGELGREGSCAKASLAKPNTTITPASDIAVDLLLPEGLYADCQVFLQQSINGQLEQVSNKVAIPPFRVISKESATPQITMISAVPALTSNFLPTFTIYTTQPGLIVPVSGGCLGSINPATYAKHKGDNTVTFGQPVFGEISSCTLRLYAHTGYYADFILPPFKVDTSLPVSTPPTVSNSNQSNSTNTTQNTTGATSSNSTTPSPTTVDQPSATVTLPAGTPLCANFKDVPADSPYCPAIQYAKSINAMTGHADGTFEPNGFLKRDQIAKIALITFNKFDSSADYCRSIPPFYDVLQSAWAFQHICRAKAANIVTGYLSGEDNGYYRPDRSVSRAEFLAIILRNLQETLPAGPSYLDVQPGNWFATYARFSRDHELFTGASLNPHSYTTRAEVAQVLYKLHQLERI